MLPMLLNGPRLRAFGPSFASLLEEAAPRAHVPAFDVRELDDRFEIKLDVPGVRRDDLKLSLEEGVLTIQGERKAPEVKEGELYRSERWSGSFERTLTLSDSLDTSRLAAKLEDGVLTITVPKAEKAKPREIKIES